jgi:hypothetical protein
MRLGLPLVGLGLFALGGICPKTKQTDPLDSFRRYRTWYCDTPEAVDMDARIALLCIPPMTPPNPMDLHGRYLFKIWVNPRGKAAFLSAKPVQFPVGSIVLKEKFQVEGTKKDAWSQHRLAKDARPVLLTAMLKREPGYDPANGDWEYVVLNGDASSQSTEGLENCAKCHADMKAKDFVFLRHSVGVGRGSVITIGKPTLRP